jgi:hypothetical protein
VEEPASVTTEAVLKNVRERVGDLPAGVAGLETWLMTAASEELDSLQTRLEGWFNEKMDRVSGWYKRKTQVFLLLIGLALALGFNADSLMVGRTLWNNANLRDSVSATAQAIVQSGGSLCQQASVTGATQSFDDQLSCLSSDVGQINGLGLPLGWPTPRGLDIRHPTTLFRGLGGDPRTWNSSHYLGQVLQKVLGLLLTALAISLGAPFWFELLGRAINLRSSGQPPERTAATAA